MCSAVLPIFEASGRARAGVATALTEKQYEAKHEQEEGEAEICMKEGAGGIRVGYLTLHLP